jgi:NAD(P)-dependent dehydrogenase (short-subunit alcohol dehydrogenase family)
MSGTLLVTGGSRGIGAACCVRAARDGWAVAVNYNGSAEAAERVVAAIREAGGQAAAFKANVSDEAQVAALFDEAAAAFGPVAGLVNNAGIIDLKTAFADISAERFSRLMATNVTGAFLCAREAVRRMARSRGGNGGAIVNISSKAAVLGAPGDFVDYAMTKGAIDALTLGLGKEVAADGIRVNGIRPGLIETDMQAASGDPERARRLGRTVPMGREGQPEEIAEAVAWLLSPAAGYVTGVTFDVSGGR